MPLTLALLIGLKMGCYWEKNEGGADYCLSTTLIVRWGDCDWWMLGQMCVGSKPHWWETTWSYAMPQYCVWGEGGYTLCRCTWLCMHSQTLKSTNPSLLHWVLCVYHQEHTLTQNKCGTPKSWQYLIHSDSLAKLHIKALITSSLNIDFKDGWSKYLHTCSDQGIWMTKKRIKEKEEWGRGWEDFTLQGC